MTTALDRREVLVARLPDPPGRALLVVEALRALRHPALLGGGLLTLLLTVAVAAEPGVSWALFAGFPLLPLAGGAMVAAHSVATRVRRDGADDLVGCLPAGRLAAVVPPLAVAAAATAVAAVATAAVAGWTAWPGVTVHMHLSQRPLPLPGWEVAEGPLVVALLALLGAVMGRITRAAVLPIVVMAVLALVEVPLVTWATESPLRYLAPSASSARTLWITGDPNPGTSTVTGFDSAAAGWHVLYLAGLVALLTAIVVGARGGRRTTVVGAVALGVTVVGGVLQVAAA
jgi:hypothetical protein